MDVTEDVRRAVYAADCESWGHQFDVRSALGGTDRPNPNDPHGFPMPVLTGPDPGQMPHLTCTRCGAVWLVIDAPGAGYADAVTQVADRLAALTPQDTTPLTPLPVPGVGDEIPIPLAPGVVFDDLPETHPAKVFARQRAAEQAHQDAAAAAQEGPVHTHD